MFEKFQERAAVLKASGLGKFETSLQQVPKQPHNLRAAIEALYHRDVDIPFAAWGRLCLEVNGTLYVFANYSHTRKVSVEVTISETIDPVRTGVSLDDSLAEAERLVEELTGAAE